MLARFWTRLYFNRKHKLWELVFVLALLNTQLDSFSGEANGGWGTRETKRAASISAQINHATPPSSYVGLWNAFLVIMWKDLLFIYNIYTCEEQFFRMYFLLDMQCDKYFPIFLRKE